MAQQVAEVVLGIAFDGFVHDDSLDYDEAQILPSRNQRLDCQTDANCKTPQNASEFRRLDLGDQLPVLYGDDHQPRQIKEQTFVQLSANYQHLLRRQVEIVERASQRGPVVLRDPEDLTKSPSPDSDEP